MSTIPGFDDSQDWENFYPVKWLIDGGPPMDLCPDWPVTLAETMVIGYTSDDSRVQGDWIIGTSGKVLFKSKDRQDIINYLRKWADGLERFLEPLE